MDQVKYPLTCLSTVFNADGENCGAVEVKLKKSDHALLKKCRIASQYFKNGDPIKDVMGGYELAQAISLLIKLTDYKEQA